MWLAQSMGGLKGSLGTILEKNPRDLHLEEVFGETISNHFSFAHAVYSSLGL